MVCGIELSNETKFSITSNSIDFHDKLKGSKGVHDLATVEPFSMPPLPLPAFLKYRPVVKPKEFRLFIYGWHAAPLNDEILSVICPQLLYSANQKDPAYLFRQ